MATPESSDKVWKYGRVGATHFRRQAQINYVAVYRPEGRFHDARRTAFLQAAGETISTPKSSKDLERPDRIAPDDLPDTQAFIFEENRS